MQIMIAMAARTPVQFALPDFLMSLQGMTNLLHCQAFLWSSHTSIPKNGIMPACPRHLLMKADVPAGSSHSCGECAHHEHGAFA